MSIKVKRGLAINLPTLEEGELGFTTDSYEMYVGSDNGNILLNNGEILIRRNNGMLQYAQSSRKNQWFDICSLEEIRGDQGVQGIQGIQGIKGDKGDKGERGIQGEKGNPFTYADFTPDQLRALKGEKGDTGAKGERGLTGDKGDRGVGLNYAWSGTRLGVKRDTDAQYTYVDLRGADGKDGKQGERGERGIQGEKGETPSIAHLEQQVSDKSKELDTKFNTLTAKQQQDAEVVTARDGEVSLNARLERDLAKGKIHFVDIEGSNITTESEEGYLENVEILGNTWQNANNLSDIRSVGNKVEGQELYEIPVLSCGKNIFNPSVHTTLTKVGDEYSVNTVTNNHVSYKLKPNTDYTLSFKKSSVDCWVYVDVKNYVNGNNSNMDFRKTYRTDSSGILSISIRANTVNNIGNKIKALQLEEGTQATPYEPYQEDRLTILSPTPLEKVGNVADRIICKDGVWGVEKNIKTTYTKELVSSVGSYEDKTGTYKWGLNLDTPKTFLLTNFLQTGVLSTEPTQTQVMIYNHSTHREFRIAFKKSDFSNFDVKSNVVDYLSNETRFVKIVQQPQFIPLPHDQQVKLRTFANKTNISFLTEIEPTIKAQVPKSLGATVNTHTTQIDNLNKELDRVKKLEESTVSTVTSSKAFTTVAETTQGYFEDVKIEGKTLVNLATVKSASFEFKTGNPSNGQDINLLRNIKGTHTLIADVKSNTLNKGIKILIKSTDNVSIYPTPIPQGTVGRVALTFDTTKNGVEYDVAYLRLYTDNSTSGSVEIDNIIILEGDHTDKDLSYFEGLKSVGQGSDEISVKSVNPNGNLFDGTLEVGSLNASGDTNWISYVKTGLIRVKPSSEVICKIGKYKGENATSTDIRLAEYDTNKNFIKFSGGTYKATVSDKTHYVKVAKKIETSDDIRVDINAVSDVVVVYGNELHNIPHQSDKKQILYFNPNTQTWEKPVLREWDSIEKHSDGKYYYHKRSGEIVLDGGARYIFPYNNNTNENVKVFAFSLNNITKNTMFPTVLCDKLVYEKEGYKKGYTCISTYVDSSSSTAYITIDKTKLTTQDVEGFKQWLQANNVTVVYQLAKEEVYECTNLDLITYSGETNLIVNSGAIQPKLELKVLSNVSNVIKLLQEKVSILENKFIKGLQQVLAGDMMSLAHLLYPEDFTLENDTPQVIPYIEEGDINE